MTNITHELKTHTEYFRDLFTEAKRFEVRKNDRDFKVGDILILRDYDDVKERYNKGYIIAKITYILNGGNFGIEDNYVVMSFRIIEKEDSEYLPF